MKDSNINQTSKCQRTLLTALLLSAPGPIATGIPAIMSHSATQIADFLRRTAELIAIFVSWQVYRKLQGSMEAEENYRSSMEHMANLTVAGAMVCSGFAMLIVGVVRLYVYEASGNVIMGLVISVLGVLTNGWFWIHYRNIAKERFDVIIAGQQKLYRSKTAVDICVVTALTSVTVAPKHPATRYIDAVGCIIVACYLLYSGFDMIRKNMTMKNSDDI